MTSKITDIEWSTWRAKDPATLVFIVENGQVLLIRKKRGLGAGKINAPGGRLEANETPRAAAVREVQEELVITPADLHYCGENRFQFVDGYSIHVHIYHSTKYTGVPTETEEATPIWAPVSDIPYDQMWEDDHLWVPLVLQRRRFSGKFIFDGDRMLDFHLEIEDPN